MEFYNDMNDCPAWNFLEVSNTGDLKHIGKAQPFQEIKEKKDYIDSLNAWDQMNMQFYDRYGISPKQKIILSIRKTILILKIEIATGGLRHAQSLLARELFKFNNLMKTDGNFNPFSVVPMVSKSMGFHLNIKDISAFEFFDYLELVKNTNQDGVKTD